MWEFSSQYDSLNFSFTKKRENFIKFYVEILLMSFSFIKGGESYHNVLKHFSYPPGSLSAPENYCILQTNLGHFTWLLIIGP